MKIIKRNVKEEDKEYALDILNKLRSGVRVFGSPAEGLKKTLSKLEENAPEEDNINTLEYHLNDSEYEEKKAKLKKGIKGEETLAEYWEKVIRLDPVLSDIIVYASLGDETQQKDKDYIPDTDFLCIYGKDILVVDAKNINTKPDIPIFVQGNGIYSALNHDEPILEVNPSTGYWKRTFEEEYQGEEINSIIGCVCIINKTGCEIFKDDDWLNSDIKPIHISELVEYLHGWVEEKESEFDLNLLTLIMKKQIRKTESGLDLTYGKRMFGV